MLNLPRDSDQHLKCLKVALLAKHARIAESAKNEIFSMPLLDRLHIDTCLKVKR
jgi:hypothetical protein